MTRFSTSHIPAPANWQDFESLCCDLWMRLWEDPYTQKNGRQGQPQHGVDIWGRPGNAANYEGIQCKGKTSFLSKPVTPTELKKEVKKALLFNPRLSHFTLITSGPKNVHAEECARQITEKHRAKGLFSVSVLGWGDVLERLESHEDIARKHYPWLYRSDSLERKQEALLVAQHPTELNVTDLVLKTWLGDNEAYLTLCLDNIKKLEARDVKVSLLKPKCSEDEYSERPPFTPSRIPMPTNLTIKGDSHLEIPVAPVSEAHKTFCNKDDWQLIGVGLTPEIPNALKEQILSAEEQSLDEGPVLTLSHVESQSVVFGIEVTWKSIFEQQQQLLLGGYLYYRRHATR